MEIISADDARKMVINSITTSSKKLEYFFSEVSEHASNRETKMFLYPLGNDDFSDVELEYLREVLGYDIWWDRACLWYEVSWE